MSIFLISVAEKKVSFEIAVIAPVSNGTVCNPNINRFSEACNALLAEFKLSVSRAAYLFEMEVLLKPLDFQASRFG